MTKLEKLLEKRAASLKRMQEISDASETEKGLTEEQKTEFGELKTQIKAMNEEIENLEFLEAEKAKQIKNTKEPVKTDDESETKAVQIEGTPVKLEKGLLTGAFVRVLAGAKFFGESAEDYAKKAYGENHPVIKTLIQGSGAGANTIPGDIAAEIIELLRNATIVRQMGPRGISMEHGKITVNRKDGSTQASYIGENTALNATDMSLGNLELSLKKIMGVTSVSKELLRYSVHNVEGLIRDDLVEAIRDAENAQLIRGTGTSTAPSSLSEFATAAGQVHATAAGVSPDVAAVEVVLKALIQYLEGSNISTEGARFAFSSRIKNYLMFLRDANGNRAFPEMRDGLLLDRQFMTTEAIPSNLGGGTNQSEIYLAQPSGLFLADGSRMEIQSTDVGSYQVGGNLRSTFADDSMAFKVTQEHDFEARQPNAVAKAEGVEWGA